jgi:hypothetical protein
LKLGLHVPVPRVATSRFQGMGQVLHSNCTAPPRLGPSRGEARDVVVHVAFESKFLNLGFTSWVQGLQPDACKQLWVNNWIQRVQPHHAALGVVDVQHHSPPFPAARVVAAQVDPSEKINFETRNQAHFHFIGSRVETRNQAHFQHRGEVDAIAVQPPPCPPRCTRAARWRW